MTFGLKNAPQIFQKRIDNIFKYFNYCCLIYIDDIFVFSKTIEQHKDDVLTINQRCMDHDIVLLKNKCIYVEQEVEFLGFEIKAEESILKITF